MDCVTKEVEIKVSLSPDRLPPQGGNIPLVVKAERVTHFIQYGQEINTERGLVAYEVALVNNPEGFKLDNVNGQYVLSCPPNNRNTAIQVTLVVIVNGEKYKYELTQNPQKYNVDVEIV